MQETFRLGTGRTTRRRLLGAALAGSAGLLCTVGARAAHTVRPWPVGRATPPLQLTDLDGKAWSLAALKGHPVVVNFWATWCEPCRAEMPSLDQLARLHAKSGLVVLSVNYREAPAVVRQYLAARPLSLPVLLDADGEAAGEWTPRVFPTTVLIERSGLARASVIGELDWTGETARALMAPLLTPAKPV